MNARKRPSNKVGLTILRFLPFEKLELLWKDDVALTLRPSSFFLLKIDLFEKSKLKQLYLFSFNRS